MKVAILCCIFALLAASTNAATFTVINTNDSGAGSLRQAILDANTSNGVDTIAFNIPGGGVHTISPTNALPTITDPVIIDGYTQPGSSVNTLTNANNAVLLIELNGLEAGAGLDGLTISAGNSTVRGLVINRFIGAGGWAAIRMLTKGNNVIEGNFIGTDPSGTVDLGNTGHGVAIVSGGTNQIGGATADARNIFSGNDGVGVYLYTSDNTVQGNFIGVDATGTNSLGNTSNGIFINSGTHNTVGGTTGGARNVISGNANTGIAMHSANNVVQGNFIGVDATGTKAIPNAASGIMIGVATNNFIGGTTAAARNIISGNGAEGVYLSGSASQKFNRIEGNYIGTDVTGTKAIGNERDGVWVFGGTSNYVGGAAAGAGNLIAGSGMYGVGIQQANTNFVQGNFIGTDATGTKVLSNAWDGVGIYYSKGNVISAGNVIAFNRNGVMIGDSTATQNPISGNSIFANAGLGIDNGLDGVTTNDNCDADTGPNNLQNFPVLTLATNTVTGLLIDGVLNSVASTNYRLEFFASSDCDPTGYGEGEEFLGFTNVITSATCSNQFAVTLPVTVPVGNFITATATDPAGNTSEFSACVPVTGGDCLAPPVGLVAWWPGDGNANDISGSNNGTLMNGAAFGTGKVGQAFNFDGIDDYIELGTPSNLMPTSGEFTIEGWIRVTDYPTNDMPLCPAFYPIAGFDWGWGIGLNGSGLVAFRKWSSTAASVGVLSALPISSNELHHVAGVHAPSGLWLYVDGALVGAVASADGAVYYAPGDTLQIGQYNCASYVRNFKGQIDELAFFNRALSACEIAALFDIGSGGKCQNTTPGTANCTLLPALATNQVGVAHTVTATIRTNSVALPDAIVNFLVVTGPNAGTNGCAFTSVSGTASFTYTGSTVGIDTIRAIATASTAFATGTATKVWIPASVPPTIDCPNKITTNNATGQCSRTLAFQATATGTPTPVVTYKIGSTLITSPYAFPVGTNTVSCTASNVAGTASCSFIVTVNDTQVPQASCPGNIVTNVAYGVTNAVVTFAAATATDNCPGTGVVCTPPSGSTFPLGTNTVQCVATDAVGNTGSCTFTVTVVQGAPPNQPPTALCRNVTTNASASCFQNVPASAVDNGSSDIDGTIVSRLLTPAGPYAKGTNNVTLTVVDDDGASNSCAAVIIVVDTTPPAIGPCANITTNLPAGVTNAVVTFPAPATSDSCGVTSVVSVPPSGSTFPLGTNAVVTTVTDTSGNTNSCTFSVILREAPAQVHDLAIIKMKAPKNINLNAALPALTKNVVVTIQNRSPHNEVITNLTGLVTVVAESLGTNCPNAKVVLHSGPPNVLPKTLKPKQKMNVFFDVTYDCANDPDKGVGHEDFRYLAAVHHEALDGQADTHPACDTCPRGPLPGGVDPNPDPNKPLKDKGCGTKDKATGLLGAPVTTDVVDKRP